MDPVLRDVIHQVVILLFIPVVVLGLQLVVQYAASQVRNLPTEVQRALALAATRMVAAAEQVFTDPKSGAQKRAWVYSNLHAFALHYGINVSEQDIEDALEAAVFLLTKKEGT
jgi:hypothetical protein